MIFKVNEEHCSLCFGSSNSLSARTLIGRYIIPISAWSAVSEVSWRRSFCWHNIRKSSMHHPMRGTGVGLLMMDRF